MCFLLVSLKHLFLWTLMASSLLHQFILCLGGQNSFCQVNASVVFCLQLSSDDNDLAWVIYG